MKRGTTRKKVGVLAVFALVLFVGSIFWSRYTELGVFIGGGGGYWVGRAARTQNDREAEAHLRRVVSATQYGVNIAENEVGGIKDKQARVRLWQILVRIAPNENWRSIYSRRLASDQVRSPNNGKL